ncbi:hypothetical protein BTA51_16660 [Hahella sp. CCB-MM4]|uniref:hypothetical protein n=1 Tax=Hahella sp. (strain CCB-MM4) TaxID=1926491 RepID=UPI000B9C4656|nr:hypothetical protein [Hahella sp. CCB-MM4]OZG72361.1 hypothetical protein BTA51_16660 [Hahella sp. CCB-MM4]
MRKLFTLMLILFSPFSFSASDTGIIAELYVDEGGSIAIKLDNGFPNATSDNTCSSNNGWAGNTTADPALKSALLAAKAAKSPVTVSMNGCDASGAWIKVHAVYVK